MHYLHILICSKNCSRIRQMFMSLKGAIKCFSKQRSVPLNFLSLQCDLACVGLRQLKFVTWDQAASPDSLLVRKV